MNRLVKIFSCLALISVASLASAQVTTTTENAVGKKDKATEALAKIDRRVHLTEEQRPKMTTLVNEYYTALDQLRKDESTYADKKKTLDGNYIVKAKEVLTAEQYTELEKMLNEQKK